MRYALLVEYDGSQFSGWARQKPSIITVQKVLDEAIYHFTQERVLTQGAGRTDAGVHAYGQVCHFDVAKSYEPWRMRDALNFFLKHRRVSVVAAKAVHEDFHSTRDATARHYMYKIECRHSRPALLHQRCYQSFMNLNMEAMQEAANHLVGYHDFSSFRNIHCQARTPFRHIFSAKFDAYDGGMDFHIIGSAFLYNQVRIIVGTLINVGRSRITPDQFKKILESRNRSAASPTISPYGLYLKRVFYPAHSSPFGYVFAQSPA